MKRVLIINAHPDKESYCAALSDAYFNGCREMHADAKLIHLSDLNFDPVLRYGYRIIQELEPDLLMLQEEIGEADHLVIVYPLWWATFPSLLKGLIDRAFLPGFMFKFHKNGFGWDKLMKGRSARLIVTMNTPPWYYKIFLGRPGDRALKKGVFGFAGFRPVRITHLGPIKSSDLKKRKKWLKKIEIMGKRSK